MDMIWMQGDTGQTKRQFQMFFELLLTQNYSKPVPRNDANPRRNLRRDNRVAVQRNPI